ncbi:centrosome and spindle pole associated protein 1 isoform X1 [Thunnus thynnus]|uniref:centrosome and spindle pole associated protein 1 isoform X1 n=1 Tax=Thunnus thynnus TaxID=8237 RepID=UPI003526F6AA
MLIESRACNINTVDMPPASAAQGITFNPDRGLGLGLVLGTDYERKKQKLQQELQLDYKNYVAKKKDLKTTEARPQPQGLSLPIDERVSVKEKLREERKKEYNLFLQGQAHTRRLKRGTSPVTCKPGHGQASDAVCISSPASPLPLPILNSHTNIHHPQREHAASTRDAATLTEAGDNGKNGKSTETWGPGHQERRRWHLYRPKELYSSEEELNIDKDKELDLRHRRWQDTHTPKPEYKEERRTWERRTKRAPQDIKEMEAPGVHDQNNESDSLQMPDRMTTATRSRPATSKDKAKFATGLMIGATEEQMASQLRKEQYKQELLKQIAEQQRNKKREKELELKVAATGATDPEKKPDRIKQFGAVNRHYDSWRRDVPYKPGIGVGVIGKDPDPTPEADKPIEATEQRVPPGKSRVAFPSPTMDNNTALNKLPGSRSGAAQGGPFLDYFNEDYHRGFSDMLGEVTIPRVAGVPPPKPPAVANTYNTPYDEAYYYYGTRNPLDPNHPNNQNGLPGGVQLSGNFHNPSPRPPSVRHSRRTEATDHHRASPLVFGELSADNSKQRRESAMNYQEALKQQIKEREERKRREKEEKERYDAKINAEMMAYNPWGRSGGGAPIKDQRGNLVSDLNHMHRINEESYRNPTNDEQILYGHTPRAEARSPLSHRISGFTDPSPPQQLHMHDTYKEALKQQIEENRRKQSEERERMRIEEEKEEKRLAEQRAHIQREYEEEQRKQKKIGHRLENQGWIHECKTHRPMEEKTLREEQEIEKNVPKSNKDREEEQAPVVNERDPSPPIPTLQKKQTDLVASRPSSALSQLSSRTERIASGPHLRPVPGRTNQLQDGTQEVMRELSALRRYLREKQRQLEVQLGQTDQQETHYTPPNRPRGRRVDASEPANKQDVQPATSSPSSSAACVNMQNIREFNKLKYRDTASREEVRHMFPDPPTDAQSLDIQQQALLREQQRKIRLMKREEEHDYLDQQLSHHHPRNRPGHRIHRDSILPSETTFIDVYSGDPSRDLVHQQRSLQPSPAHQERTALQRRHDYDRERDIQPAQSPQSATSLNLESEVRARNQQHSTRHDSCIDDHKGRSEGLSGDEVDVLSLRSALGRRVSVETVATEAWLRPGTSDAVKRSGCKERPGSRRDAPPWLTHRVA